MRFCTCEAYCGPYNGFWSVVFVNVEQYRRILRPFRGNTHALRALLEVNAGLKYLCYALYPILLPFVAMAPSVPSRYSFSIFIIAMAWLAFVPWVGVVLLLAGCVLEVCRVIGGMHYPKAVIVGQPLE